MRFDLDRAMEAGPLPDQNPHRPQWVFCALFACNQRMLVLLPNWGRWAEMPVSEVVPLQAEGHPIYQVIIGRLTCV